MRKFKPNYFYFLNQNPKVSSRTQTIQSTQSIFTSKRTISVHTDHIACFIHSVYWHPQNLFESYFESDIQIYTCMYVCIYVCIILVQWNYTVDVLDSFTDIVQHMWLLDCSTVLHSWKILIACKKSSSYPISQFLTHSVQLHVCVQGKGKTFCFVVWCQRFHFLQATA